MPLRVTQVGSLTRPHPLPMDSTQVHSITKPTALPAIPPTPNEETPSALGVTATELTRSAGEPVASVDRLKQEPPCKPSWMSSTAPTSGGSQCRQVAFEGFGSLDEAVEAGIIVRHATGCGGGLRLPGAALGWERRAGGPDPVRQ